MKDVRSVPAVRFSRFSDEWKKYSLGEIVEKYEEPVKTPQGGYNRLGIRSHAKGVFHTFVEEGHELSTGQLYKVKADNLIVNITFAWEHAVAITSYEDEGLLVSQRFPQFSFHGGFSPSFFKYVISQEPFHRHLWLASPGGAGRNRVLNQDEMLKFSVMVPSYSEQILIGAFFCGIDKLINNYQQKVDAVKALKKVLLTEMFPVDGSDKPRLRFKGFNDAWEQRKLGETCKITMGQSPAGETYSDIPSDYILVQGNADLKNGWVCPRVWTTQKTKTAEAGDLIMSVRAPAGAIGKTAYNVVLGRGVAGIKGNEFIFQTLVKMNINGYWKQLAAGSTFESINSSTIIEAEILVPLDTCEQESIGSFFHSIDNLITLHQRKLDNLKTMKTFFLQNMFI